MTKEQEKETIKYLEFLQNEFLEDAKQRRENGEVTGYGTMEDVDKLRALYIRFALNMLKEKDKIINKMAKYIAKEDKTEKFCDYKTVCDQNCEECVEAYFREESE